MTPPSPPPAARPPSLALRMQQASDRIAALHAQHVPAGPARHAHWQLDARPGAALFLMPGQLHFGDRAASLGTLLGSCVAITLWHPGRGLGAMCHYLLPSRPRSTADPLDGRYGEEAMQALLLHIRDAGTEPHEYHAHLHGGADMLPGGSIPLLRVGDRNIEVGRQFIERWGFQLQDVDVGGGMPRSVSLLLATGAVALRHGEGAVVPGN